MKIVVGKLFQNPAFGSSPVPPVAHLSPTDFGIDPTTSPVVSPKITKIFGADDANVIDDAGIQERSVYSIWIFVPGYVFWNTSFAYQTRHQRAKYTQPNSQWPYWRVPTTFHFYSEVWVCTVPPTPKTPIEYDTRPQYALCQKATVGGSSKETSSHNGKNTKTQPSQSHNTLWGGNR